MPKKRIGLKTKPPKNPQEFEIEMEREIARLDRADELRKKRSFIKRALAGGFTQKQAEFIYREIMLNCDYQHQGRGNYVFSKP